MIKTCVSCGEPFEAKRAAAKYCGERCKKRAQRAPSANVVAIGTATKSATPRAAEGDLTRATRKALDDADRVDTELGTAALLLARRLDLASFAETGAGVAALMKEYRATLAEALRNVEAEDDELDQIRGSAALKLLRGGRRGA